MKSIWQDGGWPRSSRIALTLTAELTKEAREPFWGQTFVNMYILALENLYNYGESHNGFSEKDETIYAVNNVCTETNWQGVAYEPRASVGRPALVLFKALKGYQEQKCEHYELQQLLVRKCTCQQNWSTSWDNVQPSYNDSIAWKPDLFLVDLEVAFVFVLSW